MKNVPPKYFSELEKRWARTWSARRDVPPPSGYKPIFSYKVVNDYRVFLANETQLIELRKRFERYTGPVVNVGGVR